MSKPRKPESLPVPAKPQRKLPEAAKATQWTKGVSGNPGGRPRGTSIKARLREVMDQDAGLNDGRTKRDVVVDALVGLAMKGDRAACEYVIDTLEGRPTQAVVSVELQPTERTQLGSVVDALRARQSSPALPAPET